MLGRKPFDQLEYARTIAGIRKGLAQARDGQGSEASEFFKQLDKQKA